jgi:uncharacterized DUF497 family protein
MDAVHSALCTEALSISTTPPLKALFLSCMQTAGLSSVNGPKKAAANLHKHGVSFEDAQTVFADEAAKLIDDPDHCKEKSRFVLLGLSCRSGLLVVHHCDQSQGHVILLVPARKAESSERNPTTKRCQVGR